MLRVFEENRSLLFLTAPMRVVPCAGIYRRSLHTRPRSGIKGVSIPSEANAKIIAKLIVKL
jgi:hypothetical protein